MTTVKCPNCETIFEVDLDYSENLNFEIHCPKCNFTTVLAQFDWMPPQRLPEGF